MNYKNIQTNQVISTVCYNRLPASQQHKWVATLQPQTHEFEYDTESNADDEENNYFINALEVAAVSEIISDLSNDDDNSSADFSSGSTSSGTDFGGGDFGGGGASDSF